MPKEMMKSRKMNPNTERINKGMRLIMWAELGATIVGAGATWPGIAPLLHKGREEAPKVEAAVLVQHQS